MTLISSSSLAQTLDAVNDAFFFGRDIPLRQREETAAFIAARLHQPHAYANTFGLFESELPGIRLFTGELATRASARHIAGEEACRALRLLNAKCPAARAALQDATASLRQRLGDPAPTGPKPDDGRQHWDWDYRGGTFCCGPCSAGLWRHLTSGGFDEPATRLARGLKCLKMMRKGEGQWRAFPFWYTLSALIEMKLPAAVDEMRYAAGRCESALKRTPSTTYGLRRAEISRRVLALV